jgi:hypothetical protein
MTQVATARSRELVGKTPIFLPVIHAEELALTLHNIDIARQAHAHGVFLISHTRPAETLLDFYREVRRKNTGLWIGLNFLDKDLFEALRMLPDDAGGLWSDSNGISEEFLEPDMIARRFRTNWRAKPGWERRLWFGGFEFKGQPKAKDVSRVASLAVQHIDVITMSGERTGVAPELAQVRRVRSLIGDHTLANASGATIDNVSYLMGAGIDIFLVSTGICKTRSDEFDPEKTFTFSELIHSSG